MRYGDLMKAQTERNSRPDSARSRAAGLSLCLGRGSVIRGLWLAHLLVANCTSECKPWKQIPAEFGDFETAIARVVQSFCTSAPSYGSLQDG